MPRKYFRSQYLIPYLFILPAAIVLVLGLIVPLYNAVYLSFFDWQLGTPWDSREWLGLDNFARLLQDDNVRQSVSVTLQYTFWTTALEMIIGIGLALALEAPIRGAAVFRTILIMPLMVSPVVVGLMWRYMLDARTGVINYYIDAIGDALPFLQQLGFQSRSWLGEPELALGALIVTDIWQWTPFIFIIILAGLQALPSDVINAAYMDGASWWQMTTRVKLPMLTSLIVIALLLRIIDVFRALEVIYIMTFGGPGRTTEVLSLMIYKTAFTSQDLGYASTVSVLLIGITLVLSLGIIFYSNPLGEQGDS